MKAPTVHLASKTDLPILNQISITSKMHWGYPEEWLEHWRADLALSTEDFEKQSIYKLQLDGKIIDFCAVAEEADHYEVSHLWVLPDFIGKGYGKLLLNSALEKVITQPKDIIVHADPNAAPFYASQGFVTFDQVESYPKGRFLTVMRRSS